MCLFLSISRDPLTFNSFLAMFTFSILINRASSFLFISLRDSGNFCLSTLACDSRNLLGLLFRLLWSYCLELKVFLDYIDDWFRAGAEESVAYRFEIRGRWSLSKMSYLPCDISTILYKSLRLSFVMTLRFSISLWLRSISFNL